MYWGIYWKASDNSFISGNGGDQECQRDDRYLFSGLPFDPSAAESYDYSTGTLTRDLGCDEQTHVEPFFAADGGTEGCGVPAAPFTTGNNAVEDATWVVEQDEDSEWVLKIMNTAVTGLGDGYDSGFANANGPTWMSILKVYDDAEACNYQAQPDCQKGLGPSGNENINDVSLARGNINDANYASIKWTILNADAIIDGTHGGVLVLEKSSQNGGGWRWTVWLEKTNAEDDGAACPGPEESLAHLIENLVDSVEQDATNLLWTEDFSGSDVDAAVWTKEIGNGCANGICGWGNQEIQYYTQDDIEIDTANQELVINTRKQSVGNQFPGTDTAYTSGRMHTRDGVNVMYGLITARISLPD
jgi:hypothetical protein